MVDIQIADGKILEQLKQLAIIYHRITFMNDTKRLKVVFLVEYNKHLALARMSALFAGF